MRKQTMAQLGDEMALDPHFTPKYEVGEQRLCFCPDSDFYKALRSGKASIETDVIESVTYDSIRLILGGNFTPILSSQLPVSSYKSPAASNSL